ncbi:MAG: MarR family transcriptional regulator [Oscillospiraceae bacterium]|nr:MarR family transcriptional regulator [Oscillospiraceae bacterium]
MENKDNEVFLTTRKLLRIGRLLLNVRSGHLKPLGITAGQSETMMFFDKNDGATVSALKTHLAISHQAARNLVERLKQRGYLTATVSAEDGRERPVHLTAEGRELCAVLKKNGTVAGGELLLCLSREELHTLYELLDKVETGSG